MSKFIVEVEFSIVFRKRNTLSINYFNYFLGSWTKLARPRFRYRDYFKYDSYKNYINTRILYMIHSMFNVNALRHLPFKLKIPARKPSTLPREE